MQTLYNYTDNFVIIIKSIFNIMIFILGIVAGWCVVTYKYCDQSNKKHWTLLSAIILGVLLMPHEFEYFVQVFWGGLISGFAGSFLYETIQHKKDKDNMNKLLSE